MDAVNSILDEKLELLEHPLELQRRAAAFKIAKLGTAAGKRAIPALKRMLAMERDVSVRKAALHALGRIWAEPGEVLSTLQRALSDLGTERAREHWGPPDRDPVAVEAVKALALTGGSSSLQLLLGLVKRYLPLFETADGCFSSLIGRIFRHEEKRRVASAILEVLPEWGDAAIEAGAVQFYAAGLRVPRLAEIAAEGLGRFGGAALHIAPTLYGFATDAHQSPKLRSVALLAVARIAESDPTVERMLLKTALREIGLLQRSAILGLARMHPLSEPSRRLMSKLVEHVSDTENEQFLLEVAAEMERGGNGGMPILLRFLRGNDAQNQLRVIHLLASLGDKAKEAIGDLTLLLLAEELRVRDAAHEALVKIGVRDIPDFTPPAEGGLALLVA